ncbi:MAG: hypothetical protein ACW98Y_13660 [Candidatus Thorarchaeota archaeon]|jgi:hypothetical protein
MSIRVLVIVLLLQGWLIGSAGMAEVEPQTVLSQDPSWSDDFEDGNYNDWGTYSCGEGVKWIGNFSVIDGALIAQYPNWNIAHHDSEVAYGSWSFDIYAIDRPQHEILVGFICENHTVDEWWKNAYIVQCVTGDYHGYTEDGVTLVRAIQWPNDVVFLDYEPTGEMHGWQHIDITRDPYGEFCVYHNGTLQITNVDQRITTSTILVFACKWDQGIDNVTVTHNEITIDEAPPRWAHSIPEIVTFNLNTPIRYDLNATDGTGIDSFWLNDTSNFAIDDNGLISNVTSLALGQIGLQVWVNDTNGYTQSATFGVIVREAPSSGFTLPLEILIVGAVSLVVMIVLVIVIMRSRKN